MVVCVRPDRLELADTVRLVEPRERVRGDRAVRRLDDAVEILPVRPRGAHARIDIGAEARRAERRAVRGGARLEVGVLDRPHAVAVRQRAAPRSARASAALTRIHARSGSCCRPCARKRVDRVDVVRAHEHLVRLRPVEDLVEQLRPLGSNLPFELGPARQPAPADEPVAVAPEPYAVLAARHARRPERDLPEVARHRCGGRAPELLGELEQQPKFAVVEIARLHHLSLGLPDE